MKNSEFRSQVYNALANLAFELDCKGVRPTKEEWDEAIEWFQTRFFEYDQPEED